MIGGAQANVPGNPSVPLTPGSPQIVLGTDYPARAIGDHVIGMQNCGIYTQDQLQKIERENALALFPKFKMSS